MEVDLYVVLEVDRGAAKEEIKRSYRKLAMKYHPDRTKGDSDAEQKFKEINAAYQILGNDQKKQQYDTYGSVGGNSGFGAGGFSADVDLGDIFSQFFGGGMGGASRKRSGVQRGEDLEQVMNLDLKTSILGGKEKISFIKYIHCNNCEGEGGSGKKTCDICRGTGHVTRTSQSLFGVVQQTVVCDSCNGTGESFEQVCNMCNGEKRERITKELDIDIPAGIDTGMIIKLEAEGNDGIGTKASGDLFIKFQINLEEKGLKRQGGHLYYDVEIDVLEAILGTKKEVKIPILGKRTINIKSGTQTNTILKLSGDGVKDISDDSKGDLFIKLVLKIPKKLSKKDKELYCELAKEKKLNVNNEKGIFEKIFGS